MAAKTGRNKLARLFSLCNDAIQITKIGYRTEGEIDKIITALQKFKDAPKPNPESDPRFKYPGKFGNRCGRCGDYIDDGGFCNCGIDHHDQAVHQA